MQWATLQIVELTQDLTVTKNGHVLVNLAQVDEITKHRDIYNNAYSCLHFSGGKMRMVSEHPTTIRSMVGSIGKAEQVTDFQAMDRAPTLVKPKPVVEKKEIEAPSFSKDFETQVGPIK